MTNSSMTNLDDEPSGAVCTYTMADSSGLLLHEPAGTRIFDLAERTALFGESIISFAANISVTPMTRSLIDQLVRAGTSVGANYLEADDADTRKDFRYKIGVCKREAKETRYWLRMIKAAVPASGDQGAHLWQEALELTRIFAAIRRNSALSEK